MASNTGLATKRRRVETDLQRILLETSTKRQKLSNPSSINPNKCAPLSPLPPTTTQSSSIDKKSQISVGPYKILAPESENSQTYTAADTRVDGRLVICRRLDRSKYVHLMNLAHRLSGGDFEDDADERRETYEQIFPSGSEMLRGDDGHFYYFEPKNFGSLHSYVVERKKLSERECLRFARQIIRLLAFCHRRRVILRDLKLRKFVFSDRERTKIRLDGVDELFVCPRKNGDVDGDDDRECDQIGDRHGCPAYVGPEILDLTQKSYSGRAADVWSLGVLLFVILYGRYPFYDTTPARLFAKIRHAQIHMLDEAGISFEARTFIRCLLRREPDERPTAVEILAHPWLQSEDRVKASSSQRSSIPSCGSRRPWQNPEGDQMVPSVDLERLEKKQTKRQGNGDEPTVPS